MTDLNDNQTREEILQKIKSGQVTMHSKAYLIWLRVFWALAICLLLAASAFLISFLVFSLQISRVGDLPQFGLHGLQEFLAFFPWLFVPAVLLFIWLMERFVRQHSFAYRIPILYLALGSVVLTILVSGIVLATPLHSTLYKSAAERRLPVVGGVYRFFGRSHPNDFYVGSLTEVKPDGCTLLTREGQSVNVVTNSATRIHGNSELQIGDTVEVVGEEQGGVVQAFDIREIPKNGLMRPPDFSP